VARRRHHRHRFTFQKRIRVLSLFASPRFALVRLVSVWVLLWVSLFRFIRSPCFSFASPLFGFYYRFHLFSWVLLRPPPFGFHYSFRFGSPCFSFASALFGFIRSPCFSFAASLFGFHYGFHRWLGAVSVSLDELL
jgi:hypothetical protein